MDTKKIDSKIKKYLALAGGITTVVSGANAQVVYTDVFAVVYIDVQSCYLDLNS